MLSKTIFLTILQVDVHGIPELCTVQEHGDQFNAYNNHALNYDQYLPLLKSAAQSYDCKFQRRTITSHSRHTVHNHEILDYSVEISEHSADLIIQAVFPGTLETLDFDIETRVNLIDANNHYVRGRPRPVQMGYDKWSKLSSKEQSIWNKISNRCWTS